MTNGTVLRDEGIKRADEHAQEAWRDEADAVLNQLSMTGIPFTTDDVWALIGATTQEPRAMGAVMLRAARDGIIRSTDSYSESARPASHRRPLRVWVGI
jgi:hypothetical protein